MTITNEYKEALKEAGDFEQFYGMQETDGLYDAIDLWQPLFYSIQIKGKNIGYIGFHEEDNALEPEIYIFEPYRNKGYGTKVLKRFIDMAFKEGLVKICREKTENPPPVYSFHKETLFPEKLIADVRVENEFSKKMMLACGFRESKKAESEFLIFVNNEDSEVGFVEISVFEITKEEYLKRRTKHDK